MKKYIVILVLTLLGYESIAQKEPIAPRKPNNGEYSIEEVKAFVQSDGTVAKWCRDNLIRMINKGYETLGNTKRVDDSNFDWIFKNVSYEFKDLGPYMNSRKNNGVPEFFMDNDGWSGNAGVFRDEGVILIIFKTQCINLLDIPQKVPKTVPGPGVITKIDTIRVPASSAGTTIVLYNQNFIENSGNSNNTNTNTVTTPASSGTEYVITDEPNNNGFTREVGWGPSYQQRQMPIMPRPRMYVEARFDVRGGRQQNYHPQQQPANHASGTGGFKTGNKVYNGTGTRGRRN